MSTTYGFATPTPFFSRTALKLLLFATTELFS